MGQWIKDACRWIDQTYVGGVPIDIFVHFFVCFALFLCLRMLLRLKPIWCFLLILGVGAWKEWFDWHAMLMSERFEEPYKDMFNNFLGAFTAYWLTRKWRKNQARTADTRNSP